jgi:Uma2 family endonuclease
LKSPTARSDSASPSKPPYTPAAGIADYWVFDVSARRLFVHRDPLSGRYSSVTVYSEDEAIAPLAAPDSPFRLSEAQ